ncbi:hypothetical protein AB3M83_09730 [Microbacterium sp. 179-B 1A2 NHS]|uniref:hypothetical protein n=1 Tax=Microbacterium sp. 179-B 1A2 NHS TaxID=3142383 RepID=UPI0039A14FB6
MKGDNAAECAAYISAWFQGLMSKRQSSASSIEMVTGRSGSGFEPVALEGLIDEILSRSMLKRASHDAARLTSPHRNEAVRLRVFESGGLVESRGRRFYVAGVDGGLQAAAIVGYLDGSSDDTDE